MANQETSTREGDPAEIAAFLRQVSGRFMALDEWLRGNVPRGAKELTAHNFLVASAGYLRLGADNFSGHISVLALVTRSLYEIRIQTKRVFLGRHELDEWSIEAIVDSIEVLEGFLRLDDRPGHPSLRENTKSEIAEYEALIKKHGFTRGRVMTPVDVAKKVGMKGHHEAFFKLLSKLVHPSSYLVNRPTLADTTQMRSFLSFYLQVSAHGIFESVRSEINAPVSWPDTLDGGK